MASLKTAGVEYKIAPAEGDFIIGTGGILSRDDLYLDNLDTVSTPTCHSAVTVRARSAADTVHRNV